ncbi:nucleotide-diphospho-sugar transferase [Aspergillus tamarii]|uniref:Nucleotide-diphospho-sugar transferase n=1 Tax=Aspergillus tamarii TaxID=41984 RepID=A0A5N6UM02_ASPTM|nr:nucleotide-diphospho-sugar transferase [Aspergillus tamarii]
MLTYRKSLIAALFLITFVILLRSSHSASSPSSPAPAHLPDEAVYSTNEGTEEQTSGQKKEVTPQQQPLKPSPSAPLRERLRYHFPYDLDNKFPAYIWQTWKYTPDSLWFGQELRGAEASWTELHPGFVHQVIPDDTQGYLIKYLYGSLPDVFEAYESLPLPVLKADFFRYLILLARGGIYSDIDTSALKPAADWLPSTYDLSTVGFVVGIEADPDRPDWHDWYSRRIQFCQWTIQSKPGHPILRDIVAYITEETLRMKKAGILKVGKMDKTIVEFTGPGAWTDAIFRYFNDPDYFNIEPDSNHNITYEDFTNQKEWRKVGDVVVLPITSFSPGVMQMGAGDYDDPMAFVKHDFEGTWKTDPSL